MRVFVTGVDGYIGAVLAPYLLERGITVIGLDTGYYRDGWLYSDNRRLAATPHTLNKDLRAVTAADLSGSEAVGGVALVINEPLGLDNSALSRRLAPDGTVAIFNVYVPHRHLYVDHRSTFMNDGV